MKKVKIMLLAAGVALSLVGCGEDKPEGTEIVFWHCLGHEKGNVFDQLIVQKFNEKYKGQYYLTLEHLAGDYSSLHEQIKTKIASYEIPALTMGYPDSFAEYITNDLEDSTILRLDDFINDPEIGLTQEELDDFVPEYYAEGTHYQFEGTWSMPMYKSTEVMYYNDSYMHGANAQNAHKFANNTEFEALYNKVNNKKVVPEEDLEALKTWCNEHEGYTYEVPKTWDEWIAVGRKMIADRKTEGYTVKNNEFYPLGYDSDANLMISQMKQRDIDYTTRFGSGGDHFTFYKGENKAKTEALITEITGYINETVLITKNSLGGNSYTNDYFNEGKLAMTVGSTGGSSYNISENFVVKLAPAPYYGERPYYIQQGPSICLFDEVTDDPVKNDEIHRGAWLLYKMLCDPTNNCSVALENSYDPVRKSSYNEDDPNSEYSKWISKAGQGLKYDIPNITKDLKDYYMTSDVFVGSSTAREEIGKTIYSVSYKKVPIATALESAYNTCVAAA